MLAYTSHTIKGKFFVFVCLFDFFFFFYCRWVLKGGSIVSRVRKQSWQLQPFSHSSPSRTFTQDTEHGGVRFA